MSVPTNLEFATEVKADRLKILWRVTLFASLLLGWLLLNVAMLQRRDVTAFIMPLAVLAIGCVITRELLNRAGYNLAAWVYALSGMVSLALALYLGDDLMMQIVPFAFPVITFIIGLLLAPANTFLIAVGATLLTIFIPAVKMGGFETFGIFQAAAIALIFLSALLAMQVTGDISQVAEWALANYQRERRFASELFENRELLERALARSQALSERLQETNTELDNARASAEEAKHFRGQFLANMSHELRTPLNAIIGFSETMLKFPAMYDGVKLPNTYEADLQQIYSSGRQLLSLINDILDLSRVDAGKLEIHMMRVELKPLINTVLSTASGLIGQKQIRLETDLPETIPDVYADEARVRQILLNLYSNAAKFTDEGAITLIVRQTEAGIQVGVRDTGIGIPKDSSELIFEEFKQAETGIRDPRAGAGLGLAISRQLLNLMGGRIWVESELGRGSTFYFILQLYREELEASNKEGDVVMFAAAAGQPNGSSAAVAEGQSSAPQSAPQQEEVQIK
jgi:signal transduction histidine kinase